MLHPNFPTVEGRYKFTDSWSVFLPEKLNRRLDDGDVVLWKRGFTVYLAAWDNDKDLPIETLYEETVYGISSSAYDIEEEIKDGIRYFSYRLIEESSDERVAAFYGYAVNGNGFIQLAVYIDSEENIDTARELLWSLESA
ncbi:hypothetical protein [Enterovibrio calviensis]|uniref:hypothetical protein n=1 Tax=Enterovibrio calviensis TaxID=91359 RepID=UPI003736E7D3